MEKDSPQILHFLNGKDKGNSNLLDCEICEIQSLEKYKILGCSISLSCIKLKLLVISDF